MIRINARKILVTLLVIDVLFVAAYVVSQLTGKLEVPLNLDAEANVPAWYSGVQMLLIAFPAMLRGLQMREEDRRSHWKIYMLAAIACVFLSADEIGTIHESLRPILTDPSRFGRFTYSDGKSAAGLVVAAIYGVIGLIIIALFWKDALKFLGEKRGRIPIVLGGVLFVVGAAVVDEFMPYNNPLLEHSAEEFLELTGTTLVLYGFLLKLRPVTIEVSDGDGAGAA